ncbi:cysteine desulfurase family protein [Chitinivibrio alkaliphilus]|uniref:Cysteine desulfurase n=1 Tax=Chitinivibrio alkaliphilus ACht1 TaxID=1313304 RepID=U7D7T0_9BACT|nr:cysteine desulfurase family protein [Chitinivibrio alkaliphilus]ERP31993.1 cysteine desulfurase [Chitinivibrio alkaliphilus ACht1]
MIYLDSAATTSPDPTVLETYTKAAQRYFGNPSSPHGMGITAESVLTQAKERTRRLLSAQEYTLFLTASATEANNLALIGLAHRYRHRGRHIISSTMEHPSILKTLSYLETRGFTLTLLRPDTRGIISPSRIQNALRDDTSMVTIMHVNNETGSISPIQELIHTVHRHSHAAFHCDAVQSLGKHGNAPITAEADTISFSPHKFHGLNGMGGLLCKKTIQLPSFIHGGGQEEGVRSGTEHCAGAAAMARALRLSLQESRKHHERLCRMNDLFRAHLTSLEGIVINSPETSSPYILNISIPDKKPEPFVSALSNAGVYISTKSACAANGTGESVPIREMTGSLRRARSSLRISFTYKTRTDEIQEALEIITNTYTRMYL